ncbi:MAG: helix-turn-helix transcriptional regulator [Ruminococcaceae bacterium]|nr:helix-turn-helix transcriptional regulator [Oscillospiraceae bacterium]
MEFNEKLQELRKSRGLTQEELAEALFVSRTAVSKWESGRGYPSIDSLKEISNYFSVSIDDLLSSDKLISIAQKENRSNIRSLCDLWFGAIDLFSVILIFLPLYPNTVDGYIYSVDFISYTQTSRFNLIVCWILYSLLILMGIVKMLFVRTDAKKGSKVIMEVSLVLNIILVVYLGLMRESYAVILAFLLLAAKTILLIKRIKNEK